MAHNGLKIVSEGVFLFLCPCLLTRFFFTILAKKIILKNIIKSAGEWKRNDPSETISPHCIAF
jgi:hypothetical protein